MRIKQGFILSVVGMAYAWLWPATGLSSPNYPFESLLERAEHVFLVRLGSRTDTNATFIVTEVLRGDEKLKILTLTYSPYRNGFPKNTSGLLLFSQGDDPYGKPESILSIGQPIKGQISYCGWILESGPGGSDKELQKLRDLMKEAHYKADKNGRKSKTPQSTLNFMVLAHPIFIGLAIYFWLTEKLRELPKTLY